MAIRLRYVYAVFSVKTSVYSIAFIIEYGFTITVYYHNQL